MNDNEAEISSLIYDDSDRRGFSVACSEVRHDRNRGKPYGRLGYYLNGYYLNNDVMREQFFTFLNDCPLARSMSIDARFLDDPEILEILTNSPDLREIRIMNEGYVLTKEVLDAFPANINIVCDEANFPLEQHDRDRVYLQHGLYKKETNYIEDDLVSAYFIEHELSDRELDYLVNAINNDNSGEYRYLSFRIYDPARYKEILTKLHDRGLSEDVRINFLGNPLYDRSEVYDGLSEICDNQIIITYNTCSDMVDFYTEEPYTVSNYHHSELEGGGITNFDSYFRLLEVLEEQESHIREHNYSPLEAAIYVYRFLQQNYAYDPEHMVTDENNMLTNRQLDIVANNSTMVCAGYATLYSALMRRCGIPMFRYSTACHAENIARIIDPKYDVDTIGIFDSTNDGSDIDENGQFIENQRFEFFMISPRVSPLYDDFVTIPTSLVLDYDAYEDIPLAYISRSPREQGFHFEYVADGYAITMLDRMGIQLPDPLTFASYRELVANLNRTTIFDNIDLFAFLDAYETVLRSENPNISDEEINSYINVALESINDRISFLDNASSMLHANEIAGSPEYHSILLPADHTLDIADFNKREVHNEENTIINIVDEDNNVVVTDSVGIDENIVSGGIFDPVNHDEASSNTIDSQEASDVNTEVMDERSDEDNVITHEEVSNIITDSMNEINFDEDVVNHGEVADVLINSVGNNDEYIAGTNIRKPRFRDAYETDDEYVDYLADYYSRYFPQAVEKDREDHVSYHLIRDQIIQDLPINSRQESRYSGLMSADEISSARRRL